MTRFFAFIFSLWAGVLSAQPVNYSVDLSKSTVDFIYSFQGNPIRGSLPLRTSTVAIDVNNIRNSTVTAVHDVNRATGGFIFATQILRGSDMLDGANHPTVTFRSTGFQGDIPRGTMTGNLTMRGVTRPVTLSAELFRQPGTDPSDLTRLAIELKGTLDRRDYGMTAYPGFVDPEIDIRIMSWITRDP
ncbi:MAG: YceI family protein [Pseudomonadota bacterium]